MKKGTRFVAASLTAAAFLFSPAVPPAFASPTPQQLTMEQNKVVKLDGDIHKIMRVLKASTSELRHRAQTMSDTERATTQKNLLKFHEEIKKAQTLRGEIEDYHTLYYAAQAKKDYSKMHSVLILLVEKKTEQLAALQSAHAEIEAEVKRVRQLKPVPPSEHGPKHL
ncbi:hypothetical protein [Tumebacillus flagellatus]|uniref:Uncharacterized protein n=1 Tax=Tumebacillus flagellatus TaxID=1157490 RepID=A0A074LQA2_9BACL|nr:hypothetical protein [Tumebacillus flagellatus]KEO82650.1 hypothetical protein EL26_13875 [Tumebacillus flagellatus]